MRRSISILIGLALLALIGGCSVTEEGHVAPTASDGPQVLSGDQIAASYAPKAPGAKFKGRLEKGVKKVLLSVEKAEVSGTVESITDEGDMILRQDNETIRVKLGYRYKLLVSLGVIKDKIKEGMKISVKGDLMTIEVTKEDGTVEKESRLIAREVRDSEGKLLFIALPDVEKIVITRSSVEISGTVAEVLDNGFILKADDKAYLVRVARGFLDKEKIEKLKEEEIKVTVKGQLISHEYIVGDESLVLLTINPEEIKAGEEVIFPVKPMKRGKFPRFRGWIW
jgi:hypothetical protein